MAATTPGAPPPSRTTRTPNRHSCFRSVRAWDFSTARRDWGRCRGFGLVRSRRASWSLRAISCGWCGKYVRESESGRGRRWCSDACRMKSYRAHKRASSSTAQDSLQREVSDTCVNKPKKTCHGAGIQEISLVMNPNSSRRSHSRRRDRALKALGSSFVLRHVASRKTRSLVAAG